jgi:hypothetical protein
VEPPNLNHRWFAGACAALNADRGGAAGLSSMWSPSSDTERGSPLALQAGVERPNPNLGGKPAQQRTVDGNAEPNSKRKQQRVPLTLQDKFTIATFTKGAGNRMSSKWPTGATKRATWRWPRSLSKAPSPRYASALTRSYARACPQVGTWCIGTGSRRRVLTRG